VFIAPKIASAAFDAPTVSNNKDDPNETPCGFFPNNTAIVAGNLHTSLFSSYLPRFDRYDLQ
jgi:hypothetical protein